jgi:hypothetical protein
MQPSLLQRESGISKTFMAHDWPGLVEDMSGHLTTLFERGHIKTAASDLFSRKDLDDHAPPPGYFMIHQTVMGSEEGYGFNNNGDSYPDETLKRDHPTFVTHGRVYREHRNRDPEKAIGVIKAARYSQKMQRVELLKHLEISKAEKEYEMAKAGKELHASMACRVPFDVCSCCEQKAKYASLYCSHLKERMMQWIPSFKKYAHARNTICTFFDSSVVENPAAREAKHIEYRFGPELLKAASTRPSFSGAQWAEFEGVDLSQHLTMNQTETSILQKLASIEASNAPDRYRDNVSMHGFANTHNLRDEEWAAVQKLLPGTLFNKLARRRVLLPFDLFAAYATGRNPSEIRSDADFTKAASMLPGIFRALASALEGGSSGGGCGCNQEDMDMFRASSNSAAAFDPGSSDEVDKVMDKATEQFSAEAEPIRRRAIVMITIKKAQARGPVLPAPAPLDLPPLLSLYGLYKIAAVRDMLHLAQDNKQDVEHELLRCSVDQNSFAL